MDVTTKFVEGDEAYLRSKALLGVLSRVRIVSRRVYNLGGSSKISYIIYSRGGLYNTWYVERDLLTLEEAKSLAISILEEQIAEDQALLLELQMVSSSSSSSSSSSL